MSLRKKVEDIVRRLYAVVDASEITASSALPLMVAIGLDEALGRKRSKKRWKQMERAMDCVHAEEDRLRKARVK